MNKDVIAALAKAAGLERALTEFPDDVAAAASQAQAMTKAVRYPAEPDAEPWPPMRAGSGL